MTKKQRILGLIKKSGPALETGLDEMRKDLEAVFGPLAKLPCGAQGELPTVLSKEILAGLQGGLDEAQFDMDLAAWETQFRASLASEGDQIDAHLLVSDLIGPNARKLASELNWLEFRKFIEPLDVWGFLELLEAHPDLELVTAAELGTLVDLTLLSWSVWSQGLSGTLQVVEIGGAMGDWLTRYIPPSQWRRSTIA